MTSYFVTRRVHHARQKLFDLVADVEQYPAFVPFILATRVDRRTPPDIQVEMLVGFGPLRRRIKSVGVLKSPSQIDVTSRDAPFKYFEFHWHFEAIARDVAQVEFRAAFEFRGALWQRLFAAQVSRGLSAMVEAFLHRADQLYGKAGANAGGQKPSS